MSSANLIKVGQLNQYIKECFAKSTFFNNIRVEGELSNFKKYASGHCYFSLKDNEAAIRCTMFRHAAVGLDFVPQQGQAVIVEGEVSFYPKNGDCQINVRKMVPVGTGDLHAEYEKLKQKLLNEGVFKTEATRKALPLYSKKIGVVTSPTGAVIRDMVRVLKRRWPMVDILLVPATVQGEKGAASICESLNILYQRDDVDLIIVGRGGGSLEDLWNFNEEPVVRMIANSPKPIISAVGHEPDVTLADFAADKRAGTPSIAAEVAVKDWHDVAREINSKKEQFKVRVQSILESKQKHLQGYLSSGYLLDSMKILGEYVMLLDQREHDLEQSIKDRIIEKNNLFRQYVASMEALNPLSVLARGFSYCEKDGHAIVSVEQIDVGDSLQVAFSDGLVKTEVTSIEERKQKNEC